MKLHTSPASLRWRYLIIVCLLIMLTANVQQAAMQSIAARNLATLLNQARQAEGIAPLSWSTLLAQAAQRHADDLAAHNLIDTTGSDGSTYRQRIRETGYRAWDDGLLVHEALWAGLGQAENAMTWFRNTAEEWSTFMDPRFREVGVGYAESQNIRYFVISFGSRPGVLPIFINEGAETTAFPQIAIRLTNEDAVPLGEGRWIGKAIEVRVGETPNLEDALWQPWEPLLPWLLSTSTPGDYAIYVEFRDGAGRTAIGQDTIRMVAPGEDEIPPTAPRLEEPLPTMDPAGGVGDVLNATATPIGELPMSPEPTPLAELFAPPTEVTAPTSAANDGATSPIPITPTPVQALVSERRPADWPLIMVILLQGTAVLLGVAAFLRRK